MSSYAQNHELPDLLKDRSFDFIIAIDFIEHLEKKDGWKLLDWMEKNSNIAAIIYTPNGFLYQPSIEEGDFQEHKSGWDVSDFRGLGYSCVGGAGAKILRKEFHEIRFKPLFLVFDIASFSNCGLSLFPELLRRFGHLKSNANEPPHYK